MKKQTIAFIINPNAGVKQKITAELIERYLDTQKFETSIYYTKRAGHAIEIARDQAGQKVDLIVACGGDGTVNEVAQGLTHTSSALGIIPQGSGNGLARHLGIPINSKKALRIIASGKDQLINGGKINDQLFLCAAGFGFDAHIANLFQQQKKRGLINYIKLILKELKNYPTFSIHHPDEKKTFNQLFLCSVANANQFGNDFKLVAQKNVTDDFLQLVMVKKPNFLQFLRLGFHARFGNPENLPFVHTYSFQRIDDLTIPSSLIHLDGEPKTLKQNKVKIELIPNVIKVRY
jgi:YegS/Rv2252/BmrU family lipid kinase